MLQILLLSVKRQGQRLQDLLQRYLLPGDIRSYFQILLGFPPQLAVRLYRTDPRILS